MPKKRFRFERDDRIMSPRQIMTKFLDCNLYDFLAFSVWYFKRDMTCLTCIETRRLGSGTPPDCFKCGLPTARILRKHFGNVGENDEEI